VTKPTTINAITDIPAKIPRPIGSTEIFFPGIWKAAEVVDAEAEALSATVTADVPLLVDFEAFVVAPVVGDGVGDGVMVGTEEEPELELVGVATDEDEEETVMLERGMEEREARDVEDDAEAVTEVLFTEERELVAIVEVEAVDLEVVDLEVVVDAGVTVHCRTTCTRGSPFDPVTGVNVIVHVWVTGPALV
jgi:hypothetical protein